MSKVQLQHKSLTQWHHVLTHCSSHHFGTVANTMTPQVRYSWCLYLYISTLNFCLFRLLDSIPLHGEASYTPSSSEDSQQVLSTPTTPDSGDLLDKMPDAEASGAEAASTSLACLDLNAPARRQRIRIVDLPTELLDRILDYAEHQEPFQGFSTIQHYPTNEVNPLKAFRLVCKTFNNLAIPRLFKTIVLYQHAGYWKNLEYLANHTDLPPAYSTSKLRTSATSCR